MPTKIEWTEETWNPVTGCTKVSPGCAHCYAETFAERFRGVAGHYYERGFDVQLRPDKLEEPLRWKKPRRVFVNSMSDLFHEDVPWQFVARVFGVMARTPQHTYQILTKRPVLMHAIVSSPMFANEVACHAPDLLDGTLFPWPLSNVWLGVSVENQHFADERIPLLLQTPAAVRFLSCEPLLGPVDLIPYCMGYAGNGGGEQEDHYYRLSSPELHWVIVGGESGPKARPMDLAWARSLVEQCRAAGVPVFVKQLGSAHRCPHSVKGGCLDCAPEDLRIQEFPR